MTFDELKEKAHRLPQLPGVYLMHNKDGTVIYVGKAKSLRNRVSQYFADLAAHTLKTRRMVANIDHFETIFASSELDALLLATTLITKYNAAVITEDAVSWKMQKMETSVLNQWTYHSRLYAAARYCTTQPDMNLVQLVSFGCGLDAITTDETASILHQGNKLYTQIKIDEITNLGAVKIRLRSLFAATGQKGAR